MNCLALQGCPEERVVQAAIGLSEVYEGRKQRANSPRTARFCRTKTSSCDASQMARVE